MKYFVTVGIAVDSISNEKIAVDSISNKNPFIAIRK